MIAKSGAIILRISDQVTISDDGVVPVPPGGRQIVCSSDAGTFSIAGIDAKLKPKKGKPM